VAVNCLCEWASGAYFSGRVQRRRESLSALEVSPSAFSSPLRARVVFEVESGRLFGQALQSRWTRFWHAPARHTWSALGCCARPRSTWSLPADNTDAPSRDIQRYQGCQQAWLALSRRAVRLSTLNERFHFYALFTAGPSSWAAGQTWGKSTLCSSSRSSPTLRSPSQLRPGSSLRARTSPTSSSGPSPPPFGAVDNGIFVGFDLG